MPAPNEAASPRVEGTFDVVTTESSPGQRDLEIAGVPHPAVEAAAKLIDSVHDVAHADGRHARAWAGRRRPAVRRRPSPAAAIIRDELEGYLDCGALAASTRVALRMTVGARDLVWRALPHVIRQWVLALPFALRVRLAFDHDGTLALSGASFEQRSIRAIDASRETGNARAMEPTSARAAQ